LLSAGAGAKYLMRSEQQQGVAGTTTLREQLRHVFWIGGGSGAGKSTMAIRIAGEHGLQLYKTDDVMAEHSHRSTPESRPFLKKFMAMNMDERWLNRAPRAMFDTFHWFRGEGFNMIIEDLLHFPMKRPVIVEGLRASPVGVGSCYLAPSDARIPPSCDRAAWRTNIWLSCQNKQSGESSSKLA
jgi:hypothetical protein